MTEQQAKECVALLMLQKSILTEDEPEIEITVHGTHVGEFLTDEQYHDLKVNLIDSMRDKITESLYLEDMINAIGYNETAFVDAVKLHLVEYQPNMLTLNPEWKENSMLVNIFTLFEWVCVLCEDGTYVVSIPNDEGDILGDIQGVEVQVCDLIQTYGKDKLLEIINKL